MNCWLAIFAFVVLVGVTLCQEEPGQPPEPSFDSAPAAAAGASAAAGVDAAGSASGAGAAAAGADAAGASDAKAVAGSADVAAEGPATGSAAKSAAGAVTGGIVETVGGGGGEIVAVGGGGGAVAAVGGGGGVVAASGGAVAAVGVAPVLAATDTDTTVEVLQSTVPNDEGVSTHIKGGFDQCSKTLTPEKKEQLQKEMKKCTTSATGEENPLKKVAKILETQQCVEEKVKSACP